MKLDKEYRVVATHASRARNLGLTEHFTADEWLQLLDFVDHKCQACGATHKEALLTADHVISLSQGGTNTIDNIQVLCKDCNSRKYIKVIDYRTIPFVPANHRPAQVVVPRIQSSQSRKSRYPLQMPPDLYERVKSEAAAIGVSVNEFIVNAVLHYLDIKPEYERKFAEIDHRLAALEGR